MNGWNNRTIHIKTDEWREYNTWMDGWMDRTIHKKMDGWTEQHIEG